VPAKYVTVDGTAVHYLHSGPTTLPDVPPALDRGRLFVLVHAAGSNAGMWRRQVEAAAVDDSVVALDLPGHGRSSGVEGLPTLDACAEFVVRFAAALRLRRFVLVPSGTRTSPSSATLCAAGCPSSSARRRSRPPPGWTSCARHGPSR